MKGLYRVLKRLTTGHEPGDVVEGSAFKPEILAILLSEEVNALSEVRSPPLVALDGWTLRAEKLEPHGIRTILDFLNTSDEKLAEIFEYKTTRMPATWRKELERHLAIRRREVTRKR